MLQTKLEFLARPDLDLIHEHSLRLLSEVGIVMPSEEAQSILQKHGARVDGKRIYLNETMVTQALACAPATFTVHARDPRRSVNIGGDGHVFAPGYGAPFLTSPDGTTRAGTLEDYEQLTRLADALPNMDLSGHLLVAPSDVPPHSAYLHMLRASMINSSKPFMGSSQGQEGARASAEMAGILFGDGKALKERPVMVTLINTLSPLSYSDEMLGALMENARWRQPLIIAAAAQAGATGPVTLAGTLVAQNAEILAGIVLAQLISPGTPVIYGSTSTAIDMGSGGLAIGSPELSVIVTCVAQIARYYKLPSRSGGALSDAHLPDAQAGLESMMSMLTTVLSGINFVLHAGGILSSFLSFSYEKMMIDDEICGMVRRYERGLGLSADDLAFSVIAAVGPGGNFLAEPHTVERCRSEFYRPALANRRGINDWQARGHHSIADQAINRWQTVLAKHKVPVPDAAIVAGLDRYVEEHG